MVYRIFLVEDHPTVRRIYAQVLAREPGLELCGTAGSAEEALVALADTSCDLLVTDLVLPGMDGIDLVGRLRAEQPNLPALVLSAHEGEVFAQRARQAGARAYLSKREAMHTLIPAIRHVLAGGLASP